jgi:hypothetical protein
MLNWGRRRITAAFGFVICHSNFVICYDTISISQNYALPSTSDP